MPWSLYNGKAVINSMMVRCPLVDANSSHGCSSLSQVHTMTSASFAVVQWNFLAVKHAKTAIMLNA